MKSLEDLKKLRDAAQSNMSMRTDELDVLECAL